MSMSREDVDSHFAQTSFDLYKRFGLREFDNWYTLKKDQLTREEVVSALKYSSCREDAVRVLADYGARLEELKTLIKEADMLMNCTKCGRTTPEGVDPCKQCQETPNQTLCYRIISEYYKGKSAKRSGVSYMQHIDEGLIILNEMGASRVAKEAYCIHPILQEDSTLKKNMSLVSDVEPIVLMLAMEYRNVANRGLSCFQVDDPDKIYLGPLQDVHDMLIADKVQNKKDFLLYHVGSHPKSKELYIYFNNWLRALNVTEKMYDHFVNVIDNVKVIR